jgi:hypothetical protein
MECQECIEGELERVVQMGDSAVSALQQAMDSGPSAERVGSLTRFLQISTNPAPSQAAIQYQLAIYRAMYRHRAARALGFIGGDSARRVLCVSRARTELSGDERAIIDSALMRMKGGCP